MSLSQLNQAILQTPNKVSLQTVLVISSVLQTFGAVSLVGYFFRQQTISDRSTLLFSLSVLGLSAIISALTALLQYMMPQQTVSQQAVAALRRSEAKYKQLFEANPIGVVVAKFDGSISEANDAYLEMLGYTRDELHAGRVNWAEITFSKYIERDRRAIAQMRTTGACDPFEKEYHRKDGSLVPILLACAVLKDDPENTIGFMLDLTYRKQVEEALRQSEAKFRRLIEANLIGVSIAKFEGEIFEANDLFLEMVGYTREDLYAGRISWLKMTPPEYLEIDRQATENLRKTGVFTAFEKEYWRKDGSRVPVLIGHAAFDEVQEVSIGFVLDLSDRKRAEAASVLEERNRIAREIHDTLAQAFTSIMVHLEVASYKLETAPETARTCIETSYDLARSGLAEARQSISVLRSHYLENDTLYNALCLFGAQMFAHSPTQLVCKCQGERYSIQQAIEHNLLRIGQEALMNAAKYAKATKVEINLKYESKECILQVKDDGVGFELGAFALDRHFGLRGMSERGERIGAKLKIQTALGQGTDVTVVANRE